MIVSLQLKKIVLSDIIILGLIYLIPTFSHLLSFPLYLFDPMRVAVLGSIIFLANKKNAFFLALSLPLFSYLLGGHPVFFKSILIAIELLLNVALLFGLEGKFGKGLISIFFSIFLSKCFYYALKFVLISLGFLSTELISTDVIWQLFIGLVISFTYIIVERRRLG